MDQEIQVHPTEIAVQGSPDDYGSMLPALQDYAQRYPRQIANVRQDALQELENVPDLANRAYYSIPYRGSEKPVEGLTIKSAMALAGHWGHQKNGGRIIEETNTHFMIEGYFVDIQRNIWTMRPWRVSKMYKPRGSQGLIPMTSDMLRNAVLAGVSKAVRNAILATIPEWLKEEYFATAKELVVRPRIKPHTKSIKDLIIIGQKQIMQEYEVSQEEMKRYIDGLEGIVTSEEEVFQHLKGIYNGLKEGTLYADRVFGRTKEVGMPEPID